MIPVMINGTKWRERIAKWLLTQVSLGGYEETECPHPSKASGSSATEPLPEYEEIECPHLSKAPGSSKAELLPEYEETECP